VDPREYVHEIGAKLEASTDSEERAALASLLVVTGLADAAPYLADALAIETDEATRARLRVALAALDDLCV
jgi:hypothetical protein